MGKKLASSIKMTSKLNIHLLLPTITNQHLYKKIMHHHCGYTEKDKRTKAIDKCCSFRDTHYI